MYSGLLNLKQVEQRTGLKARKIFELVQKKKFPNPVRQIIRHYVWFEDEIHDWIVKELEKNLKGKN